jgi:hypothetical protein
MLLTALGVYSGSNPIFIALFFVSCGLQTLVYASLITYIEGRQKTELILAVLTALFIFAGNAARGAASWLLTLGVPPLHILIEFYSKEDAHTHTHTHIHSHTHTHTHTHTITHTHIHPHAHKI